MSEQPFVLKLVAKHLYDALRHHNPRYTIEIEDDPYRTDPGPPEKQIRIHRPYDQILVHVTDGDVTIEKERLQEWSTLGTFEMSDFNFFDLVVQALRRLRISLPDKWESQSPG